MKDANDGNPVDVLEVFQTAHFGVAHLQKNRGNGRQGKAPANPPRIRIIRLFLEESEASSDRFRTRRLVSVLWLSSVVWFARWLTDS
jgi:hypothetical protein